MEKECLTRPVDLGLCRCEDQEEEVWSSHGEDG